MKGGGVAPKLLPFDLARHAIRFCALQMLIEALGHDDAQRVDQSAARKFFEFLKDKFTQSEIQADTANKTIDHVRSVFAAAIKRETINGSNPFLGFKLKFERSQRSPYSVDFIRDRILAPGALNGLGPVCRALVFALIDTGAHLKEITGLDPQSDIRLDVEIPHIVIQPNEHRRLKNEARRREIPLIGLARHDFELFPDGFDQYRRPQGSESASANINKFLKAHDMIEPAMFVGGNDSPQSTYSFRHTFKDRLRSADLSEGVQNTLMGHSTTGMGKRYGRGYSLDTLYAGIVTLEQDFGPCLDWLTS